jgi:type I restriction enzyme M protein
MLDTATKKRIDDCRDILVGKLPDPKAQIEQITIGLIYKFMDDMDKEAVELGGKAKFFSGAFKKYSWDNLFASKVTAAEMLKLYSEALESMSQNPNIPQLFRDIFNNAYLPYRSPETLKLFLKTIGEFEYTHSEKLGDAFEYLLSVMGSQGDAGQFRTPRHIIDFLVAVVNPGKNDTILDPACGTAGFLISAFKHITDANKKGLTPDERKKLIRNFVGYDISPDMVRLSRVNLYLHGFSEPHIYEYDTLSSEDRWKENFDVILANPPFMSPKGGIRPHKKFSISSNRSEVLFVDYIAEHLNSKGRAGIIVPEGVIFQSGTAYKDLRKMLVENYLYAVVSLPAGVFNPYSGVKTSILLMDKELAKKSKEILFVKIDNDGYNLGAQRNAVKGGQLEVTIENVAKFKVNIIENKEFKNSDTIYTVSKIEIGKNGDYNLSGERYRSDSKSATVYKETFLKDVAEIIRGITFGKRDQQAEASKDTIKVATTKAAQENGIVSEALYHVPKIFLKDKSKLLRNGDILMSTANSLNLLGRTTYVNHVDNETSFGAFMTLLRADSDNVLPVYLLHMLRTEKAKNYYYSNANTTTNISNLTFEDLGNFSFPLPPLSIQQQIVTEIEAYQKIIDGAKMVVENYKPKIEIDPEWDMVELGQFVIYSQTGLVKNKTEQSAENETAYLKMDSITYDGNLLLEKAVRVKASKEELKAYTLTKGDFLFNTRNTPDLVGKSTVFFGEEKEYLFNNNILRLRFNDKLNPVYVNSLLNTDGYKKIIRSFVDGTTSVAALYPKNYLSVKIPVPGIKIQNEIVKLIEKEQALIKSNKELIEIFEQKIKDVINKIWEGTSKEYKEPKEALRSDSHLMVAEETTKYKKEKVE